MQEGILLPPPRPTNDAAGRIFLIFVDDLHLDFRNTGRIRDLFKKISKELIHDGDMFGIVSTGPSSIAIDLTYDRKRLDEAINKISGSGLQPKDIIEYAGRLAGAARSPVSRARRVLDGVRHAQQMEQVHNRRKAFIYVSNGYDFNPFSKSRAKNASERYRRCAQQRDNNDGIGRDNSPDARTNPFSKRATNSRRPICVRAVRADPRGQPRQHHDVHDRPARPRRRPGSRRESST